MIKISKLRAISQAALDDYLAILDVSDLAQSAAGSMRKIPISSIFQYSLLLIPTGAADNILIQAAIDAVAAAGGGVVFCKAGNYDIRAKIRGASSVSVEGEEWATIWNLANNTNTDILEIDGKNTVFIKNILIDGNKANQTLSSKGVNIIGNSSKVYLENVYVRNTSLDGIKVFQASDFSFKNCFAYQCGKTGLTSQGNGGINVSNANDFVLENCKADACNQEGLNIVSSYDFTIINCKGINSVVEHGIHPNLSYNFSIIGGEYNNNLIDGIKAIDCYDYSVIGAITNNNSHYGLIAASNGAAAYEVKIIGCTSKGNVRGIYTSNATTGSQNDTAIIGNNASGNSQWGIGLSGVNNSTILGNISKNNQYGIILSGTCNNNLISGNRCYDDQSVKTQLYGIADSDNNTIVNNDLTGNKNGAITTPGASSIIRNNKGYVTENSGTATINSGSTSITVSHGLSATPTLDDISVVLGENPTNDPGNIWVSSITSTQFTINCRNNPGASNLDLAWKAVIL
jgi:parallel beta-helix repeat protein